jgi:hypothetical protein
VVAADGMGFFGSFPGVLRTKTLWDGEGVCPDGLAACGIVDDDSVTPRSSGDGYDIRSGEDSEEGAGSASSR